MRRIVDLESKDEPDLPEPPSFSDTLNQTFPDTPPAAVKTLYNHSNNNNKILPNTILLSSQQQQQDSSNNNNLSNATPFSFTSTPVASSNSTNYMRSNSQSFHSANSNQSQNTTLGGKGFNQHFSRSTSYEPLDEQEEEVEEEEELSLPSFEEEHHIGGGSLDKIEEGEEDSTGAIESRRFQSQPTTTTTSRDFVVPLAGSSSGSSSDEGDGEQGPKRVSANVSIRRKPSFKSTTTPSTRFLSDENSTTSSSQSQHSQHSHSTIIPIHSKVDTSVLELPSTFSPLRELNSNTSTLPSPGIGRHVSPLPSPHSVLRTHQYEPQTPSPFNTHLQQQSSNNKSFATPLPSTKVLSDIERRKEYAMATLLRSVAKPKMTKGTPHPHKNPLTRQKQQRQERASSVEPNTNQLFEDEEEEESMLSDSTVSSMDFLNNHHNGNTSLPVALLQEGGGGGGNELHSIKGRFDNHKLASHLQSLNHELEKECFHLTSIHQDLVKDFDEANLELNLLREEKSNWEISIMEGGSRGESGREEVEVVEQVQKKKLEFEEREKRIERREKELEGMLESHRGSLELSRVQNSFEEGNRLDERERMERLLEEKEDEILELRENLVKVQVQIDSIPLVNNNTSKGSPSPSPSSTLIEKLQREVFELKDQLSESQSTLEQQEEEMSKLTNRNEYLQVDLEKAQSLVEKLTKELSQQEEEFAESNSRLEVELCQQMDRLEERLKGSQSSLEEMRIESKRTVRVVEEERDEAIRRLEGVSGSTSELGIENHAGKISILEQIIEEKDSKILHLTSELKETRFEVEEKLLNQGQDILELEEVLEDAATKMVLQEEKIESLEKLITVIKNSQGAAYKTKSKSPLGNEILSSSRDLTVSNLEEELELTRKEVEEVRFELEEEKKRNSRRSSNNDIGGGEEGEARIKTLEANKVEMEKTVNDLRKQVLQATTTTTATTSTWVNKNTGIDSTPMKYQDSSLFFKSIIGVKTPRNPSQFGDHLPAWSPGTEADATLSPYHAEIHRLELQVIELNDQLLDSNIQLGKQQLNDAKERIKVLEAQLARFMKNGGGGGNDGPSHVTEAYIKELQNDLNKVKRDAARLGSDLVKEVERKKRVENHTTDSTRALDELRLDHVKEVKGLLVLIKYLKTRITRETEFRLDSGEQKAYLVRSLRDKQALIDVTKSTLTALGCAPRSPPPRRTKFTLKGVALSLIAIQRMKSLSNEWREQSRIKTYLREVAYPEARGRPFVSSK